MVNTVFTWLKTLPGQERLKQEQLDTAPGSAGLFCLGEKELQRRQDILGTVYRRRSLIFRLCLHSTSRQTPQLFLELDRLAQDSAPILGDDQTVTVTQGSLSRDDGSGICRYEATITFTFTSEG